MQDDGQVYTPSPSVDSAAKAAAAAVTERLRARGINVPSANSGTQKPSRQAATIVEDVCPRKRVTIRWLDVFLCDT